MLSTADTLFSKSLAPQTGGQRGAKNPVFPIRVSLLTLHRGRRIGGEGYLNEVDNCR